uniref:RING-type E3 ubiquitin transferase n=1 Tax=Syphacia muris TaxID=451379 RepID=A0A0N5AGR8_9BILA
RSNVGDSTSDSDDDHQSGSTNLPSSSNHHRLRFCNYFSKDVVCPVCKRTVPADEAEVHIIMCITRPRVTYNEDKLTEDKGECAICLEEMVAGDIIARLECFCIYHKHCIDEWFRIKNCCPEHPGDD